MERMKRPTVLWAWVLFPLTLAIFKSVMKLLILCCRSLIHIIHLFVDNEFFVYHANGTTEFKLTEIKKTINCNLI